MTDTTDDVPEYFNRSEVHGILCGMLCVSEVEGNAWLRQIIDELPDGHRLTQDTRDSLLDVYERTVVELADEDFGFFPLLPSDNAPLSERTESLGRWCQGLVFGLGLGGVDERRMSAEIKEFMNDIIAISHVGLDTDRVSEEDERAYAEVVEYIRVGVMLIYRTLRPPVPRSGPH